MRFFKVTVEIEPQEEEEWCVEDEGSGDNGAQVWENTGRFARHGEDLPELYDELGRQAIAKFNGEDQNMRSYRPYIGITLIDPRGTEADVHEMTLKAIECWGLYLPPQFSLRITEELADKVIGRYGTWSRGGSPFFDTGVCILDQLRRRREGFFGERMLKAPFPLEETRRRAEGTSFKKALGAEIQRISQTGQNLTAPETGLPYIISGSTNQERREALSLLLSSLHSANRLLSDHVFELDVDRVFGWSSTDFKEFEGCGLDTLGESVRGNVMVLSYGLHDDGDTYDKDYYDVFTAIIDSLRPYLGSIQLVVVIPSQSKELEGRVRRLVGLPCVTLTADEAPSSRLDFDGCWEYLERKARGESLSPDEGLARLLRTRLEDKSFSDLDGLFDEWRTKRLVARRLPAYLPEVEARYDRGPRPGDAFLSASQRLEELIGLDEVKKRIRDQIARCEVSREAATAGLPTVTMSYHMAFEGNPGTGKTEVARLYGEILKEQGLLREGRVISTTGRSFNRELFEKAVGGVLFIDEAYDFPDGYIASLVAFMENHREDTVVILAGYTASIERFLDTNLGFRSRLGATVRFPDYEPEELQEIFRLMARRAKLRLTEEADRQMCEAFVRRGRKASQGNGRFARKLFEDVLGAQQVRLSRERPEEGWSLDALKTIELDDVLEVTQAKEAQKPALERLEELVGLSSVKEQVRAFLTEARLQRVLREREIAVTPISLHMAFLGNPGTGKTEVARLVAEVLGDAGLLCEGGLMEVTGADLRGSLLPVERFFEEARGNVLFIDEAYALMDCPSRVTELISCMENYRDDVVVILAGYTKEISLLLEVNPGFDSRVKAKVRFPDYDTDELLQILGLQATRAGFTLAPGVTEKVRPFFEWSRQQEHFGNGRMVRNCLEDARTRQATRLMGPDAASIGVGALDDGDLTRLEPEDFTDPCEAMNPLRYRTAGF